MNLYLFSDFHNEYELLKEMNKKATRADIIISAGDHTVFGFEEDKTLKQFNKWNKQVYLIHGNHEEATYTAELCKKYKNLHFIHGKEIIHEGIRLLFWGGGGFSLTDKEFDNKLNEWQTSKNANLPTILITHAPPHNTTLDLIPNNRHVGNKSVLRGIKKLQPLYAVSGHIHEAEGAEDKINKTICYNLGPIGKIITI